MIVMNAVQAVAHSHTAEVTGLITASAAMKSTAPAAEVDTAAVKAAAPSHKTAATSVEAAASHKGAASKSAAAVAAAAAASLSRRHCADRRKSQGASYEKAAKCMFDRYMHDGAPSYSDRHPVVGGAISICLQTSSDMIDRGRLDVLHNSEKRLRDLHRSASHCAVDEEHQSAGFTFDLRENRFVAIR
jgi:hypothetical protein